MSSSPPIPKSIFPASVVIPVTYNCPIVAIPLTLKFPVVVVPEILTSPIEFILSLSAPLVWKVIVSVAGNLIFVFESPV